MPNTVTFITEFQVTLAGKLMGTYSSEAAAQAAVAAMPPGTYLISGPIVQAVVAAVVTPPPFTPSPNGTIIKAKSTAAIVDAAGNNWTITAGAQVAVATYPSTTPVVDATTANVTQLVYDNALIYQENAALGWWSKKVPTDAWLSTTNPLGVVTPPVTPPPPPPVTPPPPGGASWVYYQGKMHWAGDWDDGQGKPNYALAEAGVAGPGPVMAMPGTEANEYWLPYPNQNSAGPAADGVNFNLAGFTKFTLSVKPAQAGGLLTMTFYKGDGTTDDVQFGNTVTITAAKYGPASPVAGQWNTYTIPLADFGLDQTWVYKFINDQQGTTPQVWKWDQVGFLP